MYMEKWLRDLIQNFFVGGAIVASISYLATFFSPLAGAIWWAFPLSLVPSMFYMHRQGHSNKNIAQFVLATTYALGVLFFTTFAIGEFYKEQKTGFWLPLVKGVGVWAVLGAIYYIIIKHFNLEGNF